MSSKLRFYAFLFGIIPVWLLGACSSASGGAADAAPLPEVPTAVATTIPATALPIETPVDFSSPAAPATSSAEAAPPGDETPVVTFNISGGIVGFCDELKINQDGNYTLQRLCDQEVITGTLDHGEQATLQAWHENLNDFQLNSEDNPGGADNMVTALSFNGRGEIAAEEQQQKIIYDWASGLVVRLRPQQAEPTPTPEPVAGETGLICPEISRPALLTLDVENPNLLLLIDPTGQASCEIALGQPPAGRITTAAGNIYYPVFDPEAEALQILQLKANGEKVPLPFTAVSMAEPGPFDFVVSADGAKVAWSQTIIDSTSEPPVYRNSLWLANIDGSQQITLLDGVENNELRFVAPIRFSLDGSRLFYALQPDIGGLAFNGRFDNVYSAPAAGGEAQLLYACPSADNLMCIGGLSTDGDFLTILQPTENTLQVIDQTGALVNSIPLPATDYVERTAFGPNGNLAFVSAMLLEAGEDKLPLPNPGYITFLAPPYTGEPQTLLSDNSVGTLLGWLDETRLVFGQVDPEGKTTTALLTLEGQVTALTPNIAVGVIR